MVKMVALYIRVSSLIQAEEGFSIQGQKHNLQKYCNEQGKTIFKVYVDEGITGTSINEREGLKKLLQDAQKGCFQEVITWKVSRLARSVQDLLYILKVLTDLGITLRSISENIATDSLNGTFIVQMMGAVAELERKVIVENVKQGIHQRLSQGWYSGAPIFGYDTIPKKQCEEQNLNTNLKINQEEAQVVKIIFNLYEQGQGYKAIARYLNKHNLTGKRGCTFSSNSVRTILKRRLYTGQIESKFDGKQVIIQGNHEPIITMEQWQRVEIIEKAIEREKQSEQSHEFTLNKLLKCPICGSSLISSVVTKRRRDGTQNKYYYYICSLYHNKGIRACTAKGVPALRIEEEVYHYLEEFIDNAKILSDVHSRLNAYDKTFKENMKIFNRLKQDEDKLKKRQKLLMLQFEADEISKEVFVNRINEVKQELVMIIQEMEDVQQHLNEHIKPQIPIEEIKKVFKNLKAIFKQRNAHEVRTILQTIISKITLDEQRMLQDIEFKIDKHKILVSVQEEEIPCKVN